MIKKIVKIISLAFLFSLVLIACSQREVKIEEPIKLEALDNDKFDMKEEITGDLDKEVGEEKNKDPENYSLDKRIKHPLMGDDVKVVRIDYYHDQILENSDYTYSFTDGNKGNEETVFSTNFDLDNVLLIGMTFDGNNLIDSSVKDGFSLKAGESIILNIDYPEGIPMYKLRWTVDGKEDDYVFQYNGKEGMVEFIEFHY